MQIQIKQINDTANTKLYSMSYDNLDRLIYTNIDTATDDEILNFSYNAIGNMIELLHNNGNITFSYLNSLAHAPSNMTDIAGSGAAANDTHKFTHKNSSGDAVAWLGNGGNIFLKGSCFSQTICTTNDGNSFIIANSTDSTTAFINSTGDLCIEKGDCSDLSASCDPPRDAFIVRNSSNNNMAYIDFDGDLCLTGTLYENGGSLGISRYNLIYDTNGNLLSGFGFTYKYNSFNQLSNVTDSTTGNLTAEYFYDADGNRIMKKGYGSNGVNTTTYYVDESFIQISNSSGTFNETYYYDSRDLIAMKSVNGKMLYYHPDHLGSTTLITNSSGDNFENTFYLPFGDVLSGGTERFGYTGKELDTETNLNYYGARYYDSYFMHFTQADSLLPNVYDPQQLNRYSYVLNNPYKYVDEEGNYAQVAIALGAGVIVGGVTAAIIYHQTGDWKQAAIAGGIAGGATALSIGTLGLASTTTVVGGTVVRYVGTAGTSKLVTGTALAGIGAIQSIAEQKLVQGRGFGELSYSEIGVSAIFNAAGSNIFKSAPGVISRKAGQYFPSTFGKSLFGETGSQAAISGYSEATKSSINYVVNLLFGKGKEENQQDSQSTNKWDISKIPISTIGRKEESCGVICKSFGGK